METATLFWGAGVGVAVVAVVWPLARFCLEINDDENWPFGATWLVLASGWTAFVMAVCVMERGLR